MCFEIIASSSRSRHPVYLVLERGGKERERGGERERKLEVRGMSSVIISDHFRAIAKETHCEKISLILIIILEMCELLLSNVYYLKYNLETVTFFYFSL